MGDDRPLPTKLEEQRYRQKQAEKAVKRLQQRSQQPASPFHQPQRKKQPLPAGPSMAAETPATNAPPAAPFNELEQTEEQSHAETQALHSQKLQDYKDQADKDYEAIAAKDEKIKSLEGQINEVRRQNSLVKGEYDKVKGDRDKYLKEREGWKKTVEEAERKSSLADRAREALKNEERKRYEADDRLRKAEDERDEAQRRAAELEGATAELMSTRDALHQALDQLQGARQQLDGKDGELEQHLALLNTQAEELFQSLAGGTRPEDVFGQARDLELQNLQRQDSDMSLDGRTSNTLQGNRRKGRQVSLADQIPDSAFDSSDGREDEDQEDLTMTNLNMTRARNTAKETVDNETQTVDNEARTSASKEQTLSFGPVTSVETSPAAPWPTKQAEDKPKETLSMSQITSLEIPPFVPPPAAKETKVPQKEHLSFSGIISVETPPIAPPPAKQTEVPGKGKLNDQGDTVVGYTPQKTFSPQGSESTSPTSPPSPKLSMSGYLPYGEEIRRRGEFYKAQTKRAKPLEEILSEPTAPPKQRPTTSRSVQTTSIATSSRSVQTALEPPATVTELFQRLPWWLKLVIIMAIPLYLYLLGGVLGERHMWFSANDLTRDYVMDFGIASEGPWLAPFFFWMEGQMGVQSMLLG